MLNNTGEMLQQTADAFPDRPFIIHERGRLIYRNGYEAALTFAGWLTRHGVDKGDRVAIMLANCPEFIVAYFGAQLAGAVAVTLNTQSTIHELRYFLENSGARVLVTHESMAKRFHAIAGKLPHCRFLLTTAGWDQPSPFTRILHDETATASLPPLKRTDPAAMVYTAGLTGKPLGAVLTHGNLLSQSVLLHDLFYADETARNLAVIPFFHTFSCAANLLVLVRVGGSTVLLERFTLDHVFQALERERVTYFCGVPRLFLGMLLEEGGARYDLSALQFCITGGAAMPADYIPVFEERFGAPLVEGYGLTEASPICTVTPLRGKHKPGSIGPVIPGVEVRIIDEHGKTLPTGQVGELIFRGENVMQGYHGAPEATAQVIKDGWLFTGDLGYLDDDGYIFLTGRKKRMIITSGFNVYPEEVEQAIALHPAVATSVVSAKADFLRGEIVRARVLPKEGIQLDEKDILQHCRVYLSPYKVPREIQLVSSPEELKAEEAA